MNEEEKSGTLGLAGALAVAVVFFGLAAYMRALPVRDAPVPEKEIGLSKSSYETAPARTLKKALMTDGMKCGECHAEPDPKELAAMEEPVGKGNFHEKIVLEHSERKRNNRCYNCHHKSKRDFFADHGGREIPYAEVELLCAKCHGPIYRDWENGAHGRRNGYWDKKLGKQTALACISCHDPHRPKFKEPRAAPPPRTLHSERGSGKEHRS